MFKLSEFMKNFIFKNKIIFILFIFCVLITLPFEAIGFSGYIVKIIDNIKSAQSIKQNYQDILKCIIMIAAIYISTTMFSAIKNYLEIIIHTELVTDIRNEIFKSYINKYKEKYSEIELGELISKFNILPHILEEVSDDFLHVMLPYAITIIVLIGYLYYVNIKLGLLLTGGSIILLFILRISLKISMDHILILIKKRYNTNEKIQDKMSNIYSIIINNNEEQEIKQIENIEVAHKKISKHHKIDELQLDTFYNIILICLFCAILYLYLTLFRTETNKDKLKLYGSSLLVIISLIKYINDIKWYITDFFKKNNVLNEFSDSLRNIGKIPIKGTLINFITQGLIVLNNITFGYGSNIIINKINMIFYPDKINVIIGKSGSGKTTIINLLLGLYVLNSGKITIDGVDIRKSDFEYLRKNISVINQNIKLFNNTVYYNIKYGTNATNIDVDSLIRQLNLWSVFENLENKLMTTAGINGSNLSGGQKQIILILRALLKNTKIIIFDEPTSALDNNTKQIILKTITQVKKGRTIIIVTHDDDVKQLADNLYYLGIKS